MFFTKMAIRFLASTAFVLFYMGSSYGQCPNFTLKLEQPNPDLAVYDLVLETPPGGLNNISTFNFEVNLSSGGTNIQAANPHPNISMSNMSGQGGNYRIKPEKNNNKDCVSTLDLTLLHKHLIMTESLDEYSELLAADLNADGSSISLIELFYKAL